MFSGPYSVSWFRWLNKLIILLKPLSKQQKSYKHGQFIQRYFSHWLVHYPLTSSPNLKFVSGVIGSISRNGIEQSGTEQRDKPWNCNTEQLHVCLHTYSRTTPPWQDLRCFEKGKLTDFLAIETVKSQCCRSATKCICVCV